MNININGLQLKGHRWFTSRTTVGIVLCENKVGEEKAYIGAGDSRDELLDLTNIMMFGAKFPVDVAKTLIR